MLILPPKVKSFSTFSIKKYFFSILAINPEKQKLKFSRSALFHMKAGVFLKYFYMIVAKSTFLANIDMLMTISLFESDFVT